jgi:hypothetical protein
VEGQKVVVGKIDVLRAQSVWELDAVESRAMPRQAEGKSAIYFAMTRLLRKAENNQGLMHGD